jgi:hypothetical protein
MKERCLILNGNNTKNIVPVERIALVSFKETGETFDATFYIDNAITITLDGLTKEEINKIIDIMQYKVKEEK